MGCSDSASPYDSFWTLRTAGTHFVRTIAALPARTWAEGFSSRDGPITQRCPQRRRRPYMACFPPPLPRPITATVCRHTGAATRSSPPRTHGSHRSHRWNVPEKRGSEPVPARCPAVVLSTRVALSRSCWHGRPGQCPRRQPGSSRHMQPPGLEQTQCAHRRDWPALGPDAVGKRTVLSSHCRWKQLPCRLSVCP